MKRNKTNDILYLKEKDVAKEKKLNGRSIYAKAKEDINNNPSIDVTSLLERADENTEKLIHTILDGSVRGCEIEVKF